MTENMPRPNTLLEWHTFIYQVHVSYMGCWWVFLYKPPWRRTILWWTIPDGFVSVRYSLTSYKKPTKWLKGSTIAHFSPGVNKLPRCLSYATQDRQKVKRTNDSLKQCTFTNYLTRCSVVVFLRNFFFQRL